MSSRRSFQRSRITCDTQELKDLITSWTQNEGWKFEDFATFMELVGIKLPARLSEYDSENNCFTSVSASNVKARIQLYFGSWVDSCSQIRITVGEETLCFDTNYNSKGGEDVPQVYLQIRQIDRSGKQLHSYYSQYFCDRTLKLDETHTLKVEIWEPNKPDEKTEIYVLRNRIAVEEYLLGLDNYLTADDVYGKMIEFLGFSADDISNSDKIFISYTENVDGEERVLARIFIRNGDIQEYAMTSTGETFHIFKDGSWRYQKDGTRIFYHANKDHYVFSITGPEEDIIKVELEDAIKYSKEQINELKRFVKNNF